MPGHNRRRGQGRACRTSGMLESVLLLLLHQESGHGYTLLEGLGEFGLDAMDPSMVYRALRDMEGRGWVTSSWDEKQSLGPPRRVYRITDVGDEVLAAWIQDLDVTRKILNHLVSKYRAHMKVCEGEHYPRASGGEFETEARLNLQKSQGKQKRAAEIAAFRQAM